MCRRIRIGRRSCTGKSDRCLKIDYEGAGADEWVSRKIKHQIKEKKSRKLVEAVDWGEERVRRRGMTVEFCGGGSRYNKLGLR